MPKHYGKGYGKGRMTKPGVAAKAKPKMAPGRAGTSPGRSAMAAARTGKQPGLARLQRSKVSPRKTLAMKY